ncbi:SDR family NAD(P)-dependent oxidoreductase [Pseudoruegeria sp. HB172150]|uniref:SDR family NAD(P)-dependent oxidoreductase n=1 Tax=Pseudoruegeria sp. HB172150 TaxID=2721164 RepID=UPI0020A6A0C1|nr:SDR family oxidoreductase [Pseudoruegeria sp. HB172150]
MSPADRLTSYAATEMFSLAGKTVLVTGASSGMGEALALTMAAAGAAKVIIVARRKERLDALAAAHSAFVPIACDLISETARSELIEEVHGHGRVDVLINTAGMIADVVPGEDETRENIERTMQLNLIAPFEMCQAVAPQMREAGSGAIINVASISGVVGVGRIPQASYVASKSGLVGLTRELAAQWGRWGIRVNSIAAGYFMSDLTVDMFASPKMAEWQRSRQPMNFRGEPSDFAGTALLLASDAGRFITGQAIAVDGGWTAI